MSRSPEELERKLKLALLELSEACRRMRDQAELAKLELIELATGMDRDRMRAVANQADAAIKAARSAPGQGGPQGDQSQGQ